MQALTLAGSCLGFIAYIEVSQERGSVSCPILRITNKTHLRYNQVGWLCRRFCQWFATFGAIRPLDMAAFTAFMTVYNGKVVQRKIRQQPGDIKHDNKNYPEPKLAPTAPARPAMPESNTRQQNRQANGW